MTLKNNLTGIFFFFVIFLQAQPSILWEKSHGGSFDDDAFCITRVFGNGYMIAGRSISPDGDRTNALGSDDVWLLRINDNGDTLWQKSLGGTTYEVPYIIRQLPDSGYIFAGKTASNNIDVSGNHGIEDFWVVRTDSSANIIWQKCYGGTGIDIGAELKALSDGGFVIVGRNNSNDGNITGNHGSTDIWVIRLDSLGNLLWQKSLGGSSVEWGTAIIQTSDGGYLVGGSTFSNNGDVSGNHGASDFWIVKLDSAGTLVWQKTYGGSANEQCMAIVENASGNFILCGYTVSNNGDVTGNHGSDDVWLVEINNTGTLIWQKTYGGSQSDFGYHMNIMPNGNYIVCGSSASADGDVSLNHGDYDYWIFMIDLSGNLLWETSVGGSAEDQPHYIIPHTNGNLIVTGSTRSSDGDVSFNHSAMKDYWTVMFHGMTTVNVPEAETASSFTIANENDGVRILGLQNETDYDFTVFDISGRILAEKKSQGNSAFIPLNNLPAGIYFLRVKDGEKEETIRFCRE